MADEVVTFVNLLTTNWVPGNTDGITPDIKAIYDLKRTPDLTIQDGVYLYSQGSVEIPLGIGYLDKRTEDSITIDVRSMVSRAHMLKVRGEIKRIIMAVRKNKTSTGFDIVLLPEETDLSNKTIKLWRVVLDFPLRNFAEAI